MDIERKAGKIDNIQLSAADLFKFARIAKRRGTTLSQEVARRSEANTIPAKIRYAIATIRRDRQTTPQSTTIPV